MKIEDKELHLALKLFIIILLFGISQTIFILNYFDVPKISENRDYIFGSENIQPVYKEFIWDIDFNDKIISNFENIVIWIFTLWGFMRLIDLMVFLEKYKKD